MVEQTGVRFELTVDGEKQLDRALSRFGEHLGDLSPFFEEVANLLTDIVEAQFSEQGGRTGQWQSLSPQYAKWKARIFPGQPILVATGRMRESLIGRTGDSIREISSNEMRWGSSVRTGRGAPYPVFHQRGGDTLPQRKIIDLTEEDREAIMKMLQRFLIGDPEEFYGD